MYSGGWLAVGGACGGPPLARQRQQHPGWPETAGSFGLLTWQAREALLGTGEVRVFPRKGPKMMIVA